MEFTKPILILALALFPCTVAAPPLKMKRFRAASPSAETDEAVAAPPLKRFRAASPSAETDEAGPNAIKDTKGRDVRTSLEYLIVIAGITPYSVVYKPKNETYNRVVAKSKVRKRARFSYANGTEEGPIRLNDEVIIKTIAKTPQLLEFNEEHGCVTIGGNQIQKNQIFKFVKHPDDYRAYGIVSDNILLGLSDLSPENAFLVKNASQSLKVLLVG